MPLFGSIPANQNVEVDPVWVQPGAPTAPDSGELWWDTDDTSAGITTPLGVTDGGTGATSPATARASLAVPSIGNSTTVAGAPTAGTWARGDQYLDSANVVWTCVTAGTPGVWTRVTPEMRRGSLQMTTDSNGDIAFTFSTPMSGTPSALTVTPCLPNQILIPLAHSRSATGATVRWFGPSAIHVGVSVTFTYIAWGP